MKTESMKVEDHSGVTAPMTRHPTLFLLTPLPTLNLCPKTASGPYPTLPDAVSERSAVLAPGGQPRLEI